MIAAIKNRIKRTRAWQRYVIYHRVNPRLRLLNWFVQRLVYGAWKMDFCLHFTSRITHEDKLKVGKNVWETLANCGGMYIQCINGVEIGDDTRIAAGVKIISANHSPRDLEKHIPAEPIRIGRRCWLGSNAIILPGVQLGDEVIVGAGSVVTRSFPAGSVIAGVPAKLIRSLGSEEPRH